MGRITTPTSSGQHQRISSRTIQNDLGDLNINLKIKNCREIGRGGNGIAYAGNTEHGQYVIKIFHKPAEQKREELKEIIALSKKLNEISSMPKIHQVGEIQYKGQTRPFIVMDYISGLTPAQMQTRAMYRGCYLSPEISAYLMYKALETLNHVATKLPLRIDQISHTIHHRDISEENMIVNKSGELVLIDWECGIPKFENKSVGRINNILPELIQRSINGTYEINEINERNLYDKTDVRGLGLTLYRLITGKTPYRWQLHDSNLELDAEILEQLENHNEIDAELLRRLHLTHKITQEKKAYKPTRIIPISEELEEIILETLDPNSEKVPLKRDLQKKLENYLFRDKKLPLITNEGISLYNSYFHFLGKAIRGKKISEEEEYTFIHTFGADAVNPDNRILENENLIKLTDLIQRTLMQTGEKAKAKDLTYGHLQRLCSFEQMLGEKKLNDILKQKITSKIREDYDERIEKLKNKVPSQRISAVVESHQRRLEALQNEKLERLKEIEKNKYSENREIIQKSIKTKFSTPTNDPSEEIIEEETNRYIAKLIHHATPTYED